MMKKEALLEALKAIEFIRLEEYDESKETVCPFCGNSRGEGHTSYCSVKGALEINS